MAELILTEEEKAAESCLEWDDAAIGKMVRYARMKLHLANDSGTVGIHSAMLHLCSILALTDAETATFNVEGVTRKGEPMGDYVIKVRRKPHKEKPSR